MLNYSMLEGGVTFHSNIPECCLSAKEMIPLENLPELLLLE